MNLRMAALLAGFALDLVFGDPEWLYHPVRLIGRYISFMEEKLREKMENLRLAAPVLAVSTVALTMAVTWLLLRFLSLFGRLPLFLGMATLDWMGLSVKSLAEEATEVGRCLGVSVDAARKQVARIVGRDTDKLDESGIIRATVETVAENTTDGVISPMIYAFLGGPALLWGFKAVSTLDSMVGYLDDNYRDIGWASARLDDIMNFIPARLTGLLMCAAAALTGLDGKNALRTMLRDHDKHLSPNCAWSEAAAAGALHLRLGGAHDYFGKRVDKPAIGDGGCQPGRADIFRCVRLMHATAGLAMAALALIWLILR